MDDINWDLVLPVRAHNTPANYSTKEERKARKMAAVKTRKAHRRERKQQKPTVDRWAQIAALPMEERLVALIDLANPEEGKWLSKQRLSMQRKKWDAMKFQRSLTRCFVCNRKAQCFHHVVPMSRGGGRDWRNVVPICHWCHMTIHPWLRPQDQLDQDLHDRLRRET